MFQKIAKHRANDASNDVHRPPLPKSRPDVIGLASSTLQSQPIQKVVHDFRCVIFLDKISFPSQTVNLAYSMSYIF